MIMEWKQDGEQYRAHWNHTDFQLFQNPSTKRWQLTANSKLVVETWPSAKRAMQRIDDRQQRIIIQASRVQTIQKVGVAHGRA